MAITVDQFIERLSESGLLSAADIASFQDSLPPEQRPRDVQTLATHLVKAGKLTKYQAQAVYQGKTKGLVFGDYRVLDRLGQGGMGVVLKAEHRRMKRLVAVKMIAGAALKSPDAVKRFYREVEAAAKLIHSNIVAAFDAAEVDGVHYLIMEYVEGKDLGAIVKERGPLPVAQAVDCVLQAARGLQYAHEQGIVHRDIKPANLLLDKKGTVKILDMGLARVAGLADEDEKDRLTTSGQMMGTCDYMAPEQALDTHRADARADIYALGCTLYRLLVGEPIYKGETLMQVLLAHREAPIPSLCEVRPEAPAALDAVFRTMVAKEPEDRYSSMTEVIAALEACVGKRPATGASSTDELTATLAAAQNRSSPQTLAPRSVATAAEKAEKKVARQLDATLSQQAPSVETSRVVASSEQPPAVPPKKKLPRKAIGLGLLGAAGLVALAILMPIFNRGKDGGNRENVPNEARAVNSPPSLAIAPFDEQKAKEHQEAWAKYLGVPVEITNEIGMKLVLIPPGEFTMGASPADIAEAVENAKSYKDTEWHLRRITGEGPRHSVKIGQPFSIGMYEVTQAEYQRVMGLNPSDFCLQGQKADAVAGTDTGPYPVENVSWEEAAEFCRRLSNLPQEHQAGRSYCLPTEAQWEYACRAGSAGKWWFGNEGTSLGDYAWYEKNAHGTPHPVGQKKANPWSLFDTYGNVQEWCSDWYDREYYKMSPAEDPAGAATGSRRLARGGAWGYSALDCRSAAREHFEPRDSQKKGFRVVCKTAAPQVIAPAKTGDIPPPAIAPFDEKQAKEHQEAWARHLGVSVEMTNAIGMKLMLIPPGEFTMGEGRDSHKVRIARPFYLGKYEVTQEEWAAAMDKMTDPSAFKGPKNPVEKVTWEDCQTFLKRTGEKCGLPEGSYRLPTEAQWELACRAGSEGNWSFGDTETEMDQYGWYKLNAEGKTHPVGQKRPNRWGLHDMHGNVQEWCADWYDRDYYKVSPVSDPGGPSSGSSRVSRSGSWVDAARYCRSVSRDKHGPDRGGDLLGLRACLVLPDKPGDHAATAVAAPGPVAPPLAVAPFDEKQAKENQEAWAKHLGVPVEQTNSLGMKFVLIPPGEFMMGATSEEAAWAMSKQNDPNPFWVKVTLPPHRVRITVPFYLGACDVTQSEFTKVMGTNPSAFTEKQRDMSTFKPPLSEREARYRPDIVKYMKGKDTSRHPVETVSWEEAVEFCRRLSELPGETGIRPVYRLPTEAEWEYACRAGTTTRWYCGDDEAGLADVAWFEKNSRLFTHPVGLKPANPFGLYDMHGNVCQFCSDWFGGYDASPSDDPRGPADGDIHPVRGGDCHSNPLQCRSASRNYSVRSRFVGFRVACGIPRGAVVKADDAFLQEVAALPAEQQVARVVAKLKELNPGYDGKEEHGTEGGWVVLLKFSAAQIKDISPVRALVRLNTLECGSRPPDRSPLADLTPLQRLPLTYLACGNSNVADLSPLRGMRLAGLSAGGTKVTDLSPLRGMPLTYLNCGGASAVTDLGPLQGMPLRQLIICDTRVASLAPLGGMQLTTLLCHRTKVTDLSPIQDMPLEELACTFNPQRDSPILRSIKTLKTINKLPAAEFWKQVEQGKTPPP